MFVVVFHLVATLVLSAGAYILWGRLEALSFASGAGLSFLNLAALSVTWSLILAKKLIALALGVIVFKFAILGWILYEVVRSKYLLIGWFALGMGLVVVSALIAGLRTSDDSSEEKVVR